MARVNSEPILARKIGAEVVYESLGGEAYTFLHLMDDGTSVVVPNNIVYTKRDGRYGINYQVMQHAGVRLGEHTSVQQAISEIEAQYRLDDQFLDLKFKELGIEIKGLDKTRHGENIVTGRGRKVSIRPKKGKTPVGPYQAFPDTDMVVVKYGEDYYFLPKVCRGKQGKRQGQFYLSERLVKNIGPNRFDLLEYLLSDEKEKEIDNLYLNKVKTGRGRVPGDWKEDRESVQKLNQMAESNARQIEENTVETVESALEDILTNPRLNIKKITTNIDDNLDVTFSRGGLVVEKNGKEVELTSEQFDKLLRTVEAMKDFYAA